VTTPTRFAAEYPFALDPFQLTAIDALHAGESVLVAAPTGAGKTVVAEFAVDRALASRRKCFYTTPLKALSNQKFGDFGQRYGTNNVGLLTGDNSINSEAQVVVMTTEVLRNMLYEDSSTLDGLQTVVMDEVHYLQDPYPRRGVGGGPHPSPAQRGGGVPVGGRSATRRSSANGSARSAVRPGGSRRRRPTRSSRRLHRST